MKPSKTGHSTESRQEITHTENINKGLSRTAAVIAC
jgi:hypothetical protein